MSGITRQSEQYDIFDNTPKPERVANEDPPEHIIHEFTKGRSVGAGQLNPRGIRRQHFAGQWENDIGRPGPLHPPDFYDEDTTEMREREEEHRRRNPHLYDEEPPEDPYGGVAPETPLIPLHQMLEEHSRPLPPEPPEHFGSRLGFSKAADDGGDFGGGDLGGGGDFGGPIGNDLFTYMFLQKNPHLLSEILGSRHTAAGLGPHSDEEWQRVMDHIDQTLSEGEGGGVEATLCPECGRDIPHGENVESSEHHDYTCEYHPDNQWPYKQWA